MELIELKEAEQLNSKIECIHTVNDLLFVGTLDGQLFSYIIKEESCKLKNKKNLTKKIQDIQSDQAIGLLFLQINSYIEIYSMETLDFIIRIKESYGVNIFTLDKKKRQTRLILSIGRKLILFLYTETSYKKFEEYTIYDTPLMLKFVSDTICVGYKTHYSIIKLDQMSDKTDLQFEKNDIPCLELLLDEILLRIGNVGVYVHMVGEKRGMPSTRTSVPWNSPPFKVTITFPYIIGLSNKTIQVYDIYSETLLQILDFNNGKLIHGDIFPIISTYSKVFLLKHPPLEKQIDYLIKNLKCNEAFELLDRSFKGNSKEKTILIEKMLKESGFALLFASKYEEAFNYFFDSTMDVRELINVYPKLSNSSTRGQIKDTVESKEYLFGLLRKRRQNKYNPEQISIDQALFQLYLEFDPDNDDFISILQNNHLSIEAGESILKDPIHLSLFYQGKSFNQKALQVLEKNKLYKEMIPILKIYRDPFEYAKNVIENDPNGIEVFFRLDIDTTLVLKYLYENKLKLRYTILYLEYLCEQTQDIKYHTRLALTYLEDLSFRDKLIIHLKESCFYQLDIVLERIKETNLHQEKILLFHKDKQYLECVNIFINDLKDFHGAERYILSFGDLTESYFENPLRSNLFIKLFEFSKKEFQIYLLNKYHKMINPLELLPLLNDFNLEELNNYLWNSLKTHQFYKRDSSVIKNLSRIESFQTKYSLMEIHKKKVIISQKRLCPICNNPIGNSVFVVNQQKIVTHLYCKKN